MKNYWLNQKSYQIAFLKEGEWYHLLGFGNLQDALKHYNKLHICPIRLIVYQKHPDPYYHVNKGKVLMEKESHC